jgi:predicted nucleic acid-binding protein
MEEEYPERYVVDTNVLVYATVDAAPLCDESRLWMAALQRQNAELCVTPQICREYLVVLTGDPVFDRDFTSAEALDVLAQLRKSLRLLFSSQEALDELFRLVRQYEVAGKRIHDANIVAVMGTKEISHLATYNRQDFAQFDAITLLSPPEEGQAEQQRS